MRRYHALWMAGLLLGGAAGAEVKPVGWRNESELSVARAEGNAQTETYAAKQTTAYQFDANLLKLSGHYLYGTARGVENARNWDITLRYEKDFSTDLGGYLFSSYEGDRFIGFDSRLMGGTGLKWFIYDVDRDKKYVVGEVGYTLAHEDRIAGAAVPALTSHFGRVFVEGRFPLTDTTSLKANFELLYDFASSNNLQFNFDTSIAVSMTKVLSLKAGYLGRYRETPSLVGNKNFDSMLAVSLLAKFVPDAPKAPDAPAPKS